MRGKIRNWNAINMLNWKKEQVKCKKKGRMQECNWKRERVKCKKEDRMQDGGLSVKERAKY